MSPFPRRPGCECTHLFSCHVCLAAAAARDGLVSPHSDASCCPVCGGTDSPANHRACLDEIGVWPEPRYGEE